MRQASAEGQHWFSENQLYCQYARGRVQTTRYISRRGRVGLAMIALGLAIWIYGLKVDWGLSLVLGIAITLTGVAQVGTGVVTRRDPADRVGACMAHEIQRHDGGAASRACALA